MDDQRRPHALAQGRRQGHQAAGGAFPAASGPTGELSKALSLHNSVMAGLVPAISLMHALYAPNRDARDKPAHDDRAVRDQSYKSSRRAMVALMRVRHASRLHLELAPKSFEERITLHPGRHTGLDEGVAVGFDMAIPVTASTILSGTAWGPRHARACRRRTAVKWYSRHHGNAQTARLAVLRDAAAAKSGSAQRARQLRGKVEQSTSFR